MQTLGYIISKSNLKMKFDFLKQINDLSEVKDNKPFIIIGLSEAKKIASDKFSILHKSFEKNHFWTFGRTEKRDEFEKDIKVFFNYVINEYINNIKYYYINIYNINFNILKRLVKLCYSSNLKYIYIWNDMIYIQCENSSVIGLSLKIMKYMKLDCNKIINKLKINPSNIICESDTCIPYKIQQKLKNKQYVIPYIMKLMEFKNV